MPSKEYIKPADEYYHGMADNIYLRKENPEIRRSTFSKLSVGSMKKFWEKLSAIIVVVEVSPDLGMSHPFVALQIR